jgi:hypothetical protein
MIKLNQLLKEETFTATNKQSGKTSVFKSKDSRDSAIKAGTHNPIKDTEQPSAPKAAGSDMFGGDYAKDRGGETPTKVEPKSDMGVDSVVYNKRTKTVGIVRMGDERGETKTDADGNVNTDELEPYNPMKYPHQKDAQVAPSTQKEVDARGLWNPFPSNEGMIKLSKLMENDPCWKGYKQIGMKDKNGKEVPNCVPEGIVKEAGIPKLFLKIEAVKKKIKELMDYRKAAVVPYNKETDPKKKEALKQPLIKLTAQITSYQKNLLNLLDMEEKYIQTLNQNDELELS